MANVVVTQYNDEKRAVESRLEETAAAGSLTVTFAARAGYYWKVRYMCIRSDQASVITAQSPAGTNVFKVTTPSAGIFTLEPPAKGPIGASGEALVVAATVTAVGEVYVIAEQFPVRTYNTPG